MLTGRRGTDKANAAKGAEESVAMMFEIQYACMSDQLCFVGVCQTARDPLDLASSGLWYAHLVGTLCSFTFLVYFFTFNL